MYNNKTFLAIIPARSGSKGLPNKNIKNLCGKPLIAWSIESAKQSKYLDEIMLSTDSEKIAKIAREFGANTPFLRPLNLAQDTTSTFEVVKHTIDFYKNELKKEFDFIVLLEPTSPLRENDDIDNMIEKLIDNGYSSISSIGEANTHPAICKKINNDKLEPFCKNLQITTRRQDDEKAFFPYGVAYIAKTDALLNEKTFYTRNCGFYLIKRYQCYDIDDICDFICVKSMIEKGIKI